MMDIKGEGGVNHWHFSGDNFIVLTNKAPDISRILLRESDVHL